MPRSALCSVKYYVEMSDSWQVTDYLFVRFGEHHKKTLLSKERLAYRTTGQETLCRVSDKAVLWCIPSTLTRLYRLNVASLPP